MTAFPVASAPSPEKLRGGYYTPEPLARFLAKWVGEAAGNILEPSCGDGSILKFLPSRARPTGVELFPDEAARARAAAPHAQIVGGDFFEWFTSARYDRWDGVVGNPPFIRFQNWTEPSRSLAFGVMRDAGLRPTKLTNAWVPFVVASVMALRDGGRLGMVVPAELLQVNYAAELRGLLVDEFSELTTLTFKRLLFDGALQEVVLLLGIRGKGPARIRVIECDDGDDLPTYKKLAAVPRAPALRHDREKWTKYLLTPAEIRMLRNVGAQYPSLIRLGDIADIDVGVVTGRNQFFVLRPSGASDRGLDEHVMPLVSKSAHVRGIRFGAADFAALREADAPCNLLAVDSAMPLTDHDGLQAYVSEGEAAEVHLGYKCSIRKQWWVVPSIWRPDAFLLRQIYDHPRLIANDTDATSTDTVHRVRMLNGTPPAALAAASINSITFAFSEVMGRSYGGGVLELEPREAENLPFPDPHQLGKTEIDRVDGLLRQGDLDAALDYVDRRLLIDVLGIDAEMVTKCRGAWRRLRDRRLARGRKSPLRLVR